MDNEETVESRETSSDQSSEQSSLRLHEKIGYAFGHFFNDLCAGVWYSYTLLFLQGVQQMTPQEAGAMLMLGQIGDAIFTPIVGTLSDKFGTKRKWHFFGTILCFLSFAPIFSICPYCDESSWWKFTYYAIVILIFQFAWPVVQVTHLAMIPELARNKRDRSDLTALRYSAMILSVVVVFGVTWGILRTRTSSGDKILPDDASKFRVSEAL